MQYGEHNLKVATIYHNLAGLEHARRRYSTAEPLARQSYQLHVELFGKQPPKTLADGAALGSILHGLNQWDEAIAFFEEAIAFFEQRFEHYRERNISMSAMDYSQVAHWYDTYVRTDLDLPFFLNEAQNSARVLELTSGTGRLSIPLIEAGVSLTCVDNSPEMLAILRQKLAAKGLAAKVYEMDMCNLALLEKFDLIIIPFNSFSEILRSNEQRQALKGIWNCLTDTGRFICTLHNLSIRLKSVNGQLLFRGKYSLPNEDTLFLWSVEECDYPKGTLRDRQNSLVKGIQFWELYDQNGVMQRKSFLHVQFYLHQHSEFFKLAQSQGFHQINLYGDYSYCEFQEETSPFMIWVLGKGRSQSITDS